jgi:iron(III) transport system substrate-binding protein
MRRVLLALAALACAHAAQACDNPRQMEGFKTCADVAKAEAEGSVLVYSPDPETNQAALMAAFHAAFPKIQTNYLRLQTGALYARLMAERQAQTHVADILVLTDMTFTLDFQKRKGWMQYVSPESGAFLPKYKSIPEGQFVWGAAIISGIAYNPTTVKPADAPKSWADLTDPRWKDVINVKVSTAGTQHQVWYTMRQILGEKYWQDFAKLNPRAFDSYVQQFDRTISGQDQIIENGQYSGVLQFKAKGAPIEFVFPTEGEIATPSIYGAIAEAPHPEAAKLFMDWLMGVPGQTALVKASSLHSIRPDVAPPAGGAPISAFKLLTPDDWDAFLKTHSQFVKEWDKMVGMR